jgi:phospholipase/carboxylesterase
MKFRLESGTSDPAAPLVLCLHGQGMNEDAFAAPLRRLFSLPAHFLIPRATIPMGDDGGASWYHYDGDQGRFVRELERVEQELLRFVSEVERAHGLEPAARILFGFSQGGYAAGWVALRNPEIFRGLIVSGARVKTESLDWHDPRMAGAAGIRILLCHGRRDRLVLPEAAERSHRELAERGYSVTTQTFGGGHGIHREQIGAIATWLRVNFL